MKTINPWVARPQSRHVQSHASRGKSDLVRGEDFIVRRITPYCRHAMAMVNPQDCFDEDGHLLPMRKLPEAVARACTGFEVDDAGALKKIGSSPDRVDEFSAYSC